MATYKFIIIENRAGEPFEGKLVYRVFNRKRGDQLALISWYKTWKCWVFSSQEGCVFNISCLRDIISFMDGLSS